MTFLVVRDRFGPRPVCIPRNHRPQQVVHRCGPETIIPSIGIATLSPAAPGGVEVAERPRLSEPAQPPPVDLSRPALDACLATILDHAA